MRFIWTLRIASAILLLAIGGIHLFLVLDGEGGLLVAPFLLNAVAGLGLGIALLVLRGRLLPAAAVLGLLFAAASLLALLLALTVGLFGIHEHWTFTLVPQTVVVDAVAIVVLAITSAVLARAAGLVGSGRATAMPRAR
ncbi:hypothetical protein [Amnibacterium sp.]|uniref:hypothetical protein n=1 Tax=Amnibacterium sp. TaxID=1872496 RepID=UPI0026157FFE|nr:hypothetical protein [Amnibacterium sp.]MCU1474523.1 hypothetical protein [Amnibacterium sp.]